MTDVVVDPSVTTGPIAGSTKTYRDGVSFRRVNLSDGEHLDLYDTSGPYTDPDAVHDLLNGLPPRPGIVCDRGTQLQRARSGEITAEMAFIAAREGMPATEQAIEAAIQEGLAGKSKEFTEQGNRVYLPLA